MAFREKGFTLIELIIVVIIIGILAAIAVPMMQTMKDEAITAEAISGMSAIRNAMRQYYAEVVLKFVCLSFFLLFHAIEKH